MMHQKRGCFWREREREREREMLMNVFSRLASSVVQPAYNTVNKVLMSQKQNLKDYSHRNSIHSRLSPTKSPGSPSKIFRNLNFSGDSNGGFLERAWLYSLTPWGVPAKSPGSPWIPS